MNRVRLITGTALVFFAVAGHSQWRTGGAEVEDSPWQKSVDGFGAMLMITDDPDGLFEAWGKPPSPDYGPNISEVSSARRGDVVMSFVVFAGCEPDSEGNCNCSVEYTTYRPDGTIYARHAGEAWIDKPAPPAGQLQLSMDNQGLRIEDDDPFGVYTVQAIISDHVAGKQLMLTTELTVTESE